MPLISRGSIDQVQAAADMVEVVGQYTELRKAGANYTGRCPFHEEKTPSFSVNPTEKLFYCFGCGAGGNLFGFVQQKENLDFAAAVEYLADKYGVVLEYEESSARGDAERHRRERLRALLEQATAYYERVLAEAKAAAVAREYLAQRGMADTVCHEFRLGFSLPGWDKLRDAARTRGFNDQELLDAGLVVPGKRGQPYDRFRGRIMFPLADDRGRTLGFGARTLGDEKPKYLNSPETPLYHKSEALFGLDKAKASAGREDRVYVVEGYTDVMALAQAGVQNVVASMGTALTEQQLKRLSRRHQEPVPVLRRGRRRHRRHAARPLAGPAHGPDHARGAHPRRARPGRLRAVRRRGGRLSPACRRRPDAITIPRPFGARDPRPQQARWKGTRLCATQGGPLRRQRRRSSGTRSCGTSPTASSSRPTAVRYLLSGADGRAASAQAPDEQTAPPPARRSGRSHRRRSRPRGALPGRLSGAARQGPRGARRPRRGLLRHRRDQGRIPGREAAIGA